MTQCLVCGLDRDTVEGYRVRSEDGDIMLDTNACKECRQVIDKRTT